MHGGRVKFKYAGSSPVYEFMKTEMNLNWTRL